MNICYESSFGTFLSRKVRKKKAKRVHEKILNQLRKLIFSELIRRHSVMLSKGVAEIHGSLESRHARDLRRGIARGYEQPFCLSHA